ncbi:hypothetical protein GGR58DRAFT_507678 [Xylaria digitata]|nr:hypothetical protein GGR58DRAFT_507678 [Xylaria digitata]
MMEKLAGFDPQITLCRREAVAATLMRITNMSVPRLNFIYEEASQMACRAFYEQRLNPISEEHFCYLVDQEVWKGVFALYGLKYPWIFTPPPTEWQEGMRRCRDFDNYLLRTQSKSQPQDSRTRIQDPYASRQDPIQDSTSKPSRRTPDRHHPVQYPLNKGASQSEQTYAPEQSYKPEEIYHLSQNPQPTQTFPREQNHNQPGQSSRFE